MWGRAFGWRVVHCQRCHWFGAWSFWVFNSALSWRIWACSLLNSARKFCIRSEGRLKSIAMSMSVTLGKSAGCRCSHPHKTQAQRGFPMKNREASAIPQGGTVWNACPGSRGLRLASKTTNSKQHKLEALTRLADITFKNTSDMKPGKNDKKAHIHFTPDELDFLQDNTWSRGIGSRVLWTGYAHRQSDRQKSRRVLSLGFGLSERCLRNRKKGCARRTA